MSWLRPRVPQSESLSLGKAATHGPTGNWRNRLMRSLEAWSSVGVAQGDLVGVYIPRRPEMVAAVIGVMRAGAAYVALDPAFPDQRLGYMAEHSGLRHVLAWNEAAVPSALSSGRMIIALERLDSSSVPFALLPRVSDEDLAYVLVYLWINRTTQGCAHPSVQSCQFPGKHAAIAGITEDDVLCAVTTLSFDIAALELYLPLLVGARVVLARETEQIDPDRVRDIAKKARSNDPSDHADTSETAAR